MVCLCHLRVRAAESRPSLISSLRAGVALVCDRTRVLSSSSSTLLLELLVVCPVCAGEAVLSLPPILSGVRNDQLRVVEVFECRGVKKCYEVATKC